MSDEDENQPDGITASGRVRRKTAKKVDYAKEQEFSDADIFEDSDDEPVRAPASRKKAKAGGGRGRKKGSTTKSKASAVATHVENGGHEMEEEDDDDYDNIADRVVYTEKGYDPMLPPIRERFPFLPEYEEDGSPKIELIVGRRPVDEKEDKTADDEEEGDDDAENDNANKENGELYDDEDSGSKRRPTRRRGSKNNENDAPVGKGRAKESSAGGNSNANVTEYEYLVKYRGRSYLHLEWKTGADLESMSKSSKGIYRRFLKKIAAGLDDELENPEFDPSFAIPEKIIDEADQEITVELSDKELLRWEKQREKELAEEDDEDDEENEDEKGDKESSPAGRETQNGGGEGKDDKAADASTDDKNDDWTDEDIDFAEIPMDKLREIVSRDGPYYPVVEGSNNPYRDGYVTEPPKKPRASYLFFQCTFRSYYQKRNPNATTQAEIMTILGDAWRSMSDEERAPFLQLAKEEAEQYEKERALMEKAQKPTEVWQPLRRCREVLERLAKDSFADIFLEPVDIEDFPDYDEIIDSPMDISTVRNKLENRKYQAPEQFARDMRRIWNNCKIYNQHGSAIWHVADYMSKQFERLYHAWVLEFRERYLRWADPRARPWEHTCRKHDGSCGTPDEEMVLCDHCDAMYGFKCVTPPLKKRPKKAWHCPDCKPKLKSVKGARMLSAVAENAARKRAELGDLPKKVMKQTMYLVKWAGLGYEFCTWETREDINDDRLIEAFHRLNDSFPEEADMTVDAVNKVLEEAKHINVENAGGISCVPSLRSQLYAQSRAFHFIKFGEAAPELVCNECGPKTKGAAHERTSFSGGSAVTRHPREVVECVADMTLKVARRQRDLVRSNTMLPPPLTGEYDAIIPITSKGLMLNVGEINGSVAFLGYRKFPDGSKGPTELARLIRNVGDKIIAVDGQSTIGKDFKSVIMMLRESGKNKYCYMRFLETRYTVCESSLASVGSIGRYAIHELKKKFTSDRQRMVAQRTKAVLGEEEDKAVGDQDDESSAAKEGSDDDEDSEEGSEGEFQPDSDDEELTGTVPERNPTVDAERSEMESLNRPATEASDKNDIIASPAVQSDKNKSPTLGDINTDVGTMDPPAPKGDLYRPETTRSLACRLLDVDIGYSSDEGGDEDCAFFVDGVDSTFTRLREVDNLLPKKQPGKKKGADKAPEPVPARSTEFAALGDRAKLSAAVALTTKEASVEDFDKFPYPSSKEIAENEKKQEEESQKTESPTKGKRSTVKVEQVSIQTGEVVHIWTNIESAAATLQLPLNQLRQVLRGEYHEDIGDEVGGYKWKYALAGAKPTAGVESSSRGGGGKKAKEAWLEFRDKLYDPAEPHPYKNGNRLRDYQVDGVNWLASTWYKRQGCILADEMGLGKTVQIVSYIEHLYRVEKIRGPFLVCVPLSTVEHWRREFEGWTDMVCCVYHDRQRIWRDVLREYEWYYEDRPHTPEFLKFDVLVTTYDTLIGDFDIVGQIPFRVAVVDEAHRLRNQKGKLLECMREISAKGTMQYGFQSRVLMSGTPLQNDLTELWTLLNFIEPFKFPDIDDFLMRFGNMANKEHVEALQRVISPFMLRRVKEDVAKDIPAKEETVIDVELTSIQKQYYRAIFEHNHAFLSMGSTRQTAPKLMNIQMELRKVCNHPFLLEGVEHRETERRYKELLSNGEFDGKSPEEQQHMLSEHGHVMTSGKMVLLDKLLPKLRQEGHKVLIFSQMVKMLDLISEYCEFREFQYERLDGRIRGTDRQKAIDRFERDKNSFIFLLSTRAGGVGINLTAADICILFDSDWNPQNDVQAQARCHRIGQTRDVRIYRLVTANSFEQEMFDRASKKLGLEQAVLGTFEKEEEKPSHEEMEQLLKRGAYALLDDDDQKLNEFCADDIESILKKRTRTRIVEGAKSATWLSKQGMVVSKSKFTAEDGEQVDMDDPLFWQKVMPDFVTPSILLQKLNDLQDEIEGKKRGPGRGRGRWKKKDAETTDENVDAAADAESKDKKEEGADQGKDEDTAAVDVADGLLSNETLEDMSEDDEESDKKKVQLSRTNIRKVNKFMSDLRGMMESIFEEDDDEALAKEEKDTLQKLLLTISVKEKMFSEEQRHVAKVFLKRIEGDRRRRCRTSEQPRFNPGVEGDETGISAIPEQLMIRKKVKKRRKRRGVAEEEGDEEPTPKPHKRRGSYLGEDGYLHHSDSEADWSDVADDLYQTGRKNKDKISRKESRRRRQWAGSDDAATAAGRAWPVFPRHLVKDVLTSLLDEVMKYDDSQGGIFSVPVPKDEFPEYYEQIKTPMDYGTMREKLERGEYRSAQAMQKDFILILQNCRQFNASSSDIVKEAREQHLMRPKMLKDAAMKHNLFLSEDGTVLEIFDEEKKGTPKKRKRKAPKADDDEASVEGAAGTTQKKRRKNKPENEDEPSKSAKRKKKAFAADDSTVASASDEKPTGPKTKARTKGKSAKKDSESATTTKGKSKGKSKKRKRSDSEDLVDGADASEDPVTSKKSSKSKKDGSVASKRKRGKKGHSEDPDLEVEVNGIEPEDPAMVFLDLPKWKKEREELDKSFDAAKALFTSHGPWKLPPGVPPDKFSEIALATLAKMDKLDKYSVFSEAVSDEDAPGYSEVVKNPMDFGTMREKVSSEKYGTDASAAASLYDDFLLVFENCRLYNTDDSEVTDEAARLLGHLPEAFVSSCIAASKRGPK